MRWQSGAILIRIAAPAAALALAGCAAEVPYIPAPWEPSETQLREPASPQDAAAPVWEKFGTSVRGKPLQAVTLGSGPRRIYIIGGIHGDAPEGPAVADLLPAALLADFAADAGRTTTLRIVRDMNPDGSASRTRGNTRGTDLNRNWPSRDFTPESLPGRRQGPQPASELETVAIVADLKAFKPDLVILFRSATMGRGPFVNFEGLGKGTSGPRRAYDFASAARTVDPRWRLNPGREHVTPGSAESYIGRDLRTPILTLEFQRGRDAKTNAAAVRTALLTLTAESTPPAPAPTAAAKP